MGKILLISLKLNFTPNILDCYGLVWWVYGLVKDILKIEPSLFAYVTCGQAAPFEPAAMRGTEWRKRAWRGPSWWTVTYRVVHSASGKWRFDVHPRRPRYYRAIKWARKNDEKKNEMQAPTKWRRKSKWNTCMYAYVMCDTLRLNIDSTLWGIRYAHWLWSKALMILFCKSVSHLKMKVI